MDGIEKLEGKVHRGYDACCQLTHIQCDLEPGMVHARPGSGHVRIQTAAGTRALLSVARASSKQPSHSSNSSCFR